MEIFVGIQRRYEFLPIRNSSAKIPASNKLCVSVIINPIKKEGS
jgi:hypothetical protein